MYFTRKFCVQFLFVVAVCSIVPFSYANAETTVTDDITGDTTWDVANSPYIILNPVQVSEDATLTVEAGVLVQFDYGTEIAVNGAVVANGTSENRIHITSLADTMHGGGDLDYIDLGITPTTGDYTGFIFAPSSHGTFENVQISYSDTAISGENSSLSFNNSEIIHVNNGLSVIGGSLSFSSNIFTDSVIPMMIDYQTTATHSANTFSGNVYDGIGMSGDMYGQDYTFSGGDAPYYLFSAIYVGVTNTLNIINGARLIGTEGYFVGTLNVEGGTINIIGTPESKIYLEGVITQAYDGASVRISNTEIKNIINPLVFWNTNNVILDSVQIDGTIQDAIVIFNEAEVLMRNSTISNFGRGGVTVFNDSTFTIENSTFDSGWEPVVVFNGGRVEMHDSTISNTINSAVTIFNDAEFTAEDLAVDSGIQGIVAFNHAMVDLTRTTIKNFTEAGIITFGTEEYANSNLKFRDSLITANEKGFLHSSFADFDITNNSIYGNTSGVIIETSGTYNFVNNWWGDRSGPYNEVNNPEGIGNPVSDGVIVFPWMRRDPNASRRTPVLIVPGVLGTEIIKPTDDGPLKLWLDIAHNLTDIGDQFMDPLQFNSGLEPVDDTLVLGEVIRRKSVSEDFVLFNYSEGIITQLVSQGYIENEDLFLFPYDWRYGVNDGNVASLKQKIEDILLQTGSEDLDIVAHSTGGLLIKKYIKENETSHHVGKAVFVGVPNAGAPKAIKALVEGDSFGVMVLAQSEMKKIAKNLPVVYDLSPSEFYYDVNRGYVKIIEQVSSAFRSRVLDFEETKDYLLEDYGLNRTAFLNAHNLHSRDFDMYDMRNAGVDLYAINGCKAGTIGAIVEVRTRTILGTSFNSPIQVDGDGTVPFGSSTLLPINPENKYYALKASHAEMMSQEGTRQQILNILTGSALSTMDEDGKDLITQDISKCGLNGRIISIYSPLSIDVTDEDGNHSGFSTETNSIENKIPNASYEVMGDHKFVYLPEDDGQVYTVSIKGTGEGTFTLTDASIGNNLMTGMKVFKNIPVSTSLSGIVNLLGTTTLSIDTDGDTTHDKTLYPDFTLNAEDASEFNPVDLPAEEAPKSGGGSFLYVPPPIEDKEKEIEPPEQILVKENDTKIDAPQEIFKSIVFETLPEEKTENLLSKGKQDAPENNVIPLSASASGSNINFGTKAILASILGLGGLVFIGRKFIR